MIKKLITEYTTQYDAIVIGTGISGGWAAKELCEKWFKNIGFRSWTNGKAY